MKKSKYQWFKVDDNFPVHGLKVIATYKDNSYGKDRVIIAHRLPRFFAECNCDGDCDCEYDDKTDTCYYPAGWYEQSENWDDYSCFFVNNGEITHWMPLPLAPEGSHSYADK